MNNNQWEALIKLIIPAILVIFWAINQVFQKDLTAPRTARKPTPIDPFETPPAPAGRPTVAPAAQRTSRPPAPPRPRPIRPDEEIVILSSEDRRPRATQQDPRTSRKQPPASPRNREVKRQATGAGRASDSGRPRTQGSAVRGMSDLIGDPTLMIGPLSEVRGMQQVHLENTQGGVMRRAARSTAPDVTAATTLKGIQETLKSPDRIREAFIIGELLKPPIALRGSPRNRS